MAENLLFNILLQQAVKLNGLIVGDEQCNFRNSGSGSGPVFVGNRHVRR